MIPFVKIKMPDALEARQYVPALADILMDVVEGGDSIGFMHPLHPEKAIAFWDKVADGVMRNERILIVAELDNVPVGTVQIVLNMPENQPHRADISKMLVHRRARKRGIGQALMQAAEKAAFENGKTLLVLDTASADAERLYIRQGWQRVGQIPQYALFPDGRPCSTVVFYKILES